MSRLRAKCPDCHTFTAVALGPDYQCHACGREFHAGLVRVPRAWGNDGEPMAEAALLPLAYPEASVVAEESLADQTLAIAAELPERPLILGGCCCSHVGAIEGLSARNERLAVVWIDTHGDLNTPETSPSGNEWGMPLRMAIDSGAVDPQDVMLIGARDLDPPEEEFIAASGIHQGEGDLAAVLDRTSCVYVALDVDAFEPEEVSSYMPAPGGLHVDHVERLFTRLQGHVVGAGISGGVPDPRNVAPLERLCAALGL
jgi:arginase family enzyme